MTCRNLLSKASGWVGGFQPQAAMLQIMASFMMAIMTACALMWASGAMEPSRCGSWSLVGVEAGHLNVWYILVVIYVE